MCLDEMDEYVNSRPPRIKELMREFKPGSKWLVGEDAVYVVGIAENLTNPGNDLVICSLHDPALDYDKAMADNAQRRYHVGCFREAAKPYVGN